MVGLKPIDGENETQWPQDVIDKIYGAIDEYGEELVLHSTVCSDRSIKSEIMNANCARHDIVLWAVRDGVQLNLNKILVERGLVEFDPNTKSKLEYTPNSTETDNYSGSDSDWETGCDENKRPKLNESTKQVEPKENEPNSVLGLLDDLPPEDFEDLLGKTEESKAGNDIEQAQTSVNTIPNQFIGDVGYISAGRDEPSENCFEISSDTITEDVNDAISEDPNDKALLEYIYKRPSIHWWQDEQSIVLKILAFDDVKYGLEITSESLIYG